MSSNLTLSANEAEREKAILGLKPAHSVSKPVATAGRNLANRAIDEKLFLSPRTVEKHVEHAIDKLGVGSRAEIAAWYARQALPTGNGQPES